MTRGRVPPATLAALASLNFFLADARDGLGPFLDSYLITHGWSPFDLGVLATFGGIVGLIAGAPAGAFVDSTKYKRALIVGPIILITAVAFAPVLFPNGPVVFGTQILTAILGLTVGPALTGVTLGLMGRADFGRQISRNEVWNHAGNIVLLVATYLASRAAGLGGVAALMLVTTTAAVLSTLAIDPKRIDHRVARGMSAKDEGERPSSLRFLFSNRSLVILGFVLLLFHFGNAPIARLISQEFALQMEKPFQTTAIITVVGQVSAILAAYFGPALVERFGLRAMFFVALCSLPIRGLIAGTGHDFSMIYPVQALDGIGAGFLAVLVPIAVEDLLEGSGHFNLGLAGVMTMQGVGATLSNVVAGWLVQDFGFSTAYLVHGSFSILAIVLLAGAHFINPPSPEQPAP